MKKSLVPRARNTRTAGFTLVELMIVIAIAAVLVMVAAPSLQRVTNMLRQSSATNLIMNDLNLARAEAIKRNESVLVCAKNDPETDCRASTAWGQGWIVCVMKRDNAGAATNTCADATEAMPNPIIVRPPLHANLTLTASANTPIRFLANSARDASASATGGLVSGGTFDGATTKNICVANTGSITRQDNNCP